MNFTVWIAFSPAVNFCVYIFAALVLWFFEKKHTSREEEKETCALYWPKTQMELYVNMLFLRYIIIYYYYHYYIQFFVAFDKDSNLSIQQKSDIFSICYHAQIRIYLSFKMQTMYSNNAKARGSLKLIAISFRRSLNTSES